MGAAGEQRVVHEDHGREGVEFVNLSHGVIGNSGDLALDLGLDSEDSPALEPSLRPAERLAHRGTQVVIARHPQHDRRAVRDDLVHRCGALGRTVIADISGEQDRVKRPLPQRRDDHLAQPGGGVQLRVCTGRARGRQVGVTEVE
jgi:hypothetical protein